MNKIFLLAILIGTASIGYAQTMRLDAKNHAANRSRDLNGNNNTSRRIYDYNYVEKKPFFGGGKDSLNFIYQSYFSGFDSLATRCVVNGDTAKYIRVHFEFTLDENGTPYDAKYTYVGTTRYGSSSGDKKVKYLDDLKPYFDKAVKLMVQNTPSWKPAMQNGYRVACYVKDSFQFWLGINPEPKSLIESAQ